MIRDATLADAPQITDIYNHYVAHSYATLEYNPVDSSFYVEKIHEVQQSGHYWLVAEADGKTIGYAYSRRWNARDGYEFTCEVSVYVAPEYTSGGWGHKLYETLFDRLKKAGMHSVIAVIGLPNEASVALHEKFGMKKAAYFPELGIKFGNWLDVGYWYMNL